MAIVHFLNVLEGDCNIIQHDSGRVSVIDVSNADDNDDTPAEKAKKSSAARKNMYHMTVPNGKKDYNQKDSPDNPIEYLKDKLAKNEVFRFIITHPDMDHLDGIKDFFNSFHVWNIWDTQNNKEITDFNGGGYNKEDWEFYKMIRAGKIGNRKTYLTPDSYNFFDQDCIQILAPTQELINDANECGDYNDCSYVLLFTPKRGVDKQWKILFAGDSHDKTWSYILQAHRNLVTDVDILIAPHHGRDSNRDYKFLDTLRPKVTLFGNASSRHLAYDSYRGKTDYRITNNQAGFVIMEVDPNNLNIYVKNQEFANEFRNNPKRQWGNAPFSAKHNAYFLLRYSA